MSKYYDEILKAKNKNEKNIEKEITEAYTKALVQMKQTIRAYIVDNETLSFSQQLDMKRMEMLINQINYILDNMYDGNYKAIQDSEVEDFWNDYLGVFYQVEMELRVSMNWALLNESVIRQSILMPVDGMTLSDRLYGRDLPKLKSNIKQNITLGLIQGLGYAEIARNISNSTQESMKSTMRIVRTESGRITSMATQQGQEESKDMGIKIEKRWDSTHDDRTREDHQELDGQTVDVDKPFKIGVYEAMQPRLFGVAKEDINCRCTTVSVIEGFAPEFKRDNITGEVNKIMTYKQWKESRGY